MNILCEFDKDQRQETLKVAEAGSVRNKDPFLHIKRDFIVTTTQLGQGKVDVEENEGDDEEEEEEETIIPEP